MLKFHVAKRKIKFYETITAKIDIFDSIKIKIFLWMVFKIENNEFDFKILPSSIPARLG